MTTGKLILADTSVWIQFLRGDMKRPKAEAFDLSLSQDRLVTCGPVKAEILSGLKDLAAYRRWKDYLNALREMTPRPDAWERVGEIRFQLAKRGTQASLIDLWIALTAADHDATVWSFDKDFHRIAVHLSLKLMN